VKAHRVNFMAIHPCLTSKAYVFREITMTVSREVQLGFRGSGLFCNGGALWTVPELLFESKGLIPALQQLLDDCRSVTGMIKCNTRRS